MRKFLTSVADVYAYDDSENLLFMAKTLLDSSVEVSLGSTPIRGGQGNQLQYIYYHTGEMNFKLTEAQWNLALLASTTGQSTSSGSNIYAEENVQLTRATPTGTTVTGTVTGLLSHLGQRQQSTVGLKQTTKLQTDYPHIGELSLGQLLLATLLMPMTR